MKATEFRILGPELGESDSYIDVTIDGIDNEGKVHFAEKEGGRTWIVGNREIKQLMEQNLMLENAKVETHSLWNRLGDVGGERKNTVGTDFGHDNIEKAQRSLFLAAYYETR